MTSKDKIKIHAPADFIKMRQAGKAAAEVLNYITEYVKAGVTTDELNTLCHNKILSLGGIPAPLNYRGFPKSICTSINHVVCHGIPSDRKLENGDILNIDVTVLLEGWHGDSSRMYIVGDKVSIKARRLCEITYEAMMRGIEIIKPDQSLAQIGHVIQQYAESHGFSVVRDYCGHGIGQTFHASPSVLHYYDPRYDVILEEGMFFTVEPMINAGGAATKLLQDGWTAVTRDRSLSAQYEHTIGVTSNGYEIFTL